MSIFRPLPNYLQPFDTNKDGRLSFPDFKRGLRGLNLGLTNEECEKFAQWVDMDGNCVIDTNELKERLQAVTPKILEEEKKADDQDANMNYNYGLPPTSPSTYLDGAASLNGTITPAPDDLKPYEPDTKIDESYDYIQTERFSPVKFKKPEPLHPPYETEAAAANASIASASPDARSRLSPESPYTLADSHYNDDGAYNFEEPTPLQRRDARRSMRRTSMEYGMFSPVTKGPGENPFEVPQEGASSRLGSFFRNVKAGTSDHVGSVLKEDEVAKEVEEERERQKRRNEQQEGGTPMGVDGVLSSPMGSNLSGFYKQRGARDRIDALLSEGPQPEFTIDEYERKALLKEQLKKRRDESIAEITQRKTLGSRSDLVHEETHNRTFSSHLMGASGMVKSKPGHHNDTTMKYSLASGSFDELTPSEYAEMKKKAGCDEREKHEHDHLKGTGAIMEEASEGSVALNKYSDARCNDIKKTER